MGCSVSSDLPLLGGGPRFKPPCLLSRRIRTGYYIRLAKRPVPLPSSDRGLHQINAPYLSLFIVICIDALLRRFDSCALSISSIAETGGHTKALQRAIRMFAREVTFARLSREDSERWDLVAVINYIETFNDFFYCSLGFFQRPLTIVRM